MNLKKVYRLYREEWLTVRKRGGRKRALGTRAPMAISQDPNCRTSRSKCQAGSISRDVSDAGMLMRFRFSGLHSLPAQPLRRRRQPIVPAGSRGPAYFLCD